MGDGLWAAQRAIFSRISGSWYPIAQNFARPQGHPSEDWKGLAPDSLSIGQIYGIFSQSLSVSAAESIKASCDPCISDLGCSRQNLASFYHMARRDPSR